MNDSDKDKLKDVLSTIDPVEFHWDETNTTVGIVSQDIGPITSDSIDLSDYTMIGNNVDGSVLTIGSLGVSGASAAWASNSTISFASSSSFNADTTEYGKTTIKTAKSTIDIDELADMMETLKKRLLIIAPNFEMHEKYPMLKELYNEYKAMEALLSGPDSNE
jgi:hypothetical protein